ncbi:MAG: T9SS type A sorting domain-containing protein [Flavobacteriales bacterium]|nr:T9SS type A sorting domain-containing protein [Flavobacteriales bacterium]
MRATSPDGAPWHGSSFGPHGSGAQPFHDQTRITFTVPLGSDARIELLDVQGRLLRSLSGNGTREVIIERDGLGAGLFLVRVMRDGAQLGAMRIVAE